MKQTPQRTPTQSRTVQMGSKNSPKIPIIRSQVLGPIKRPFKASNQPKHYKTLKQSVTSSRIKPLPHGVCQNSNFLVSTHNSHRVDQLCLQLRRNLRSDFHRSEKEAKREIKNKIFSLRLSLSPDAISLLFLDLSILL